MAQLRKDWRSEWDYEPLYVCSDLPIDRHREDAGGDFWPSDCGFRVTTNAGTVRQFLNKKSSKRKIVLSTYQSSPVIKEALEMKPGDKFDLGIFDEPHKTAGRVGRNYSLGLNGQDIPIKKRVFFTATPRHCSAVDETEVYSMNERKQYGG